jgi:SAM-dependent methyltransferase
MDDTEDAQNPCDVTLATYEAGAERYLAHSARPAADRVWWLSRFAAMIPGGCVLELGTGPGWDADLLETLGLSVARTDATTAFVGRLLEAGYSARVLDARADDYGGPYDGVLADAVLLHLDQARGEQAFAAALQATRPGGALAITLKEGDGAEWSLAKLDAPRHMTYWREDALLEALHRAGWAVESLEHVTGSADDWLYVIARHPEQVL